MNVGQLFTNPAYAGLLADEDQAKLQNQALMNAGLTLLASSQGGQPGTGKVPLFPALLQGLQAGQQAYTGGAEGVLKNQQIKQQRDVMAKRKQLLGGLTGAPNAVQSALAGGGGPTVANAEKMQSVQGNNLARMMDAYREALLLDDGGKTAEQIKGLIESEKPKLTKLGKGEQLIEEGTGKVVAQGAEDLPSAVREYQFAVGQGYKGSFNDFQTQLKRAGASNVSVGFGNDKQLFEGEQGLRKEFKDTPTAKAYNEVKFAYDQVATALKNPSAANDLTAATKFMKILDPGSVVRESELGLAMSATGLFDRVTNYYNQLKTGQRLTPSQREDFFRSATQLYNAALQPYAATRAQYEDVTKRYGFDPARVLGTEVPKPIPETKLNARTDPAAAAKAELERRNRERNEGKK